MATANWRPEQMLNGKRWLKITTDVQWYCSDGTKTDKQVAFEVDSVSHVIANAPVSVSFINLFLTALTNNMSKKIILSFVTGFFVLFLVYHFPEFFSAFWVMATFKIGFLMVAVIVARLQGWKGLGAYGLSLKASGVTNLLKGLLVGFVFFLLSVFISVGAGYDEITKVNSFSSIVSQLPMLLLTTAVPSVAEDILTRGYLYAHLRKYLNPYSWILLSSFVYVFNHIWRLGDGAAVLTYLFLLGLVLAYAVWIAKSLWLAFGIHWGANIAFESTHTFMNLQQVDPGNGSTWLLAASWGLLLVLFALFRLAKKDLQENYNLQA
jgi:uncharacterized protein